MDVKCTARFNFLLALFLCFSLKSDVVLGDRIAANQSLLGYQTIVSAGGNFVLGFFNPGNSSNFYIGIWYNRLSIRTPVWVANRETPVSYISSSVLKIYGGNLVLFNESSYSIWSTNLPSTNSSSLEAVLGDDGNLVLRDVSNPSQPLWQSFDHPTDTFLPGGKIGLNKKTGKNTRLTSWTSSTDPSPGLFSLELDPNGTSQFFILWNMTRRHWTSGVWNEKTKIFENLPEMRLNYLYNFRYVDDENVSYLTYSLYNTSIISRLTMDWSGHLQQTSWLENSKQWFLFWTLPRTQCDVYAYCGPFGSCNEKSQHFCRCLKGFDSKYQNDWNSAAFSRGCTRRNSLQCENPETVTGKDRFFANDNMKLPDNNEIVAGGGLKECESTCMSNCTCTAYAYDNNQCMIWYGDIVNLQQLTEGDPYAKTLYLKLAASEFSGNKNKKGIVIGSVFGSVVVVILVGLLLFVTLRRKRAIKPVKTMEDSMMSFGYRDPQNETKNFLGKLEVLVGNAPLLNDTEKRIKDLIDSGDFDEEDKKSINVHSFDFDCLVAATDDFSDANKLGRGGFGPVYKGRFAGGQEIAIKRLSSVSGQGLEEFKNEVLLIAKLQHRNLVRLLGYCFKGDEKILVYEYLSNKSLDFSLFYGNPNAFLNWEVRFNIILGIARGLLYLHQDSRLRIVHRDLKTSNILLDKELNPKISDFGLAKIVEGKKNEGCTTRVVGTYGYMSPEYALDGLFSVKSDVFSFGVVVLEILSGKKNTAYFKSEDVPSLLDYAWKLWREQKPLELMDENLSQSCNAYEFLKCMNVALLCVQDEPADRPTMSNVVVMLSSETETFPTPKQPAFFAREGFSTSTVKKVLLFSSEREEETETYLTAHSGGGK